MTFMENTQVRDLAIIMKHLSAMDQEIGNARQKDCIPGTEIGINWGDGFWLDYKVTIKNDEGVTIGEVQFEDGLVRFQGSD